MDRQMDDTVNCFVGIIKERGFWVLSNERYQVFRCEKIGV
jgi:hypothetical protein